MNEQSDTIPTIQRHPEIDAKFFIRWPDIPADFQAMLEAGEFDTTTKNYPERRTAFEKIFRLTPDRRNPSYKLFSEAPFNDHTDYYQHDGNLVLVTQPYLRHSEAQIADWLFHKVGSRLIRWSISKEWSFYYPTRSTLVYVEAEFKGKRPLR